MLKNYLKVTLRHLWRNRFYSTISIAGLAVSMASCLFMLVHLHDEWTFDHFNEKPENVVRVVFDSYTNLGKYATTPLPVGPALQNEFPEVEAMSRVSLGFKSLVKNEDKRFFETLAFVDTDLTEIFDLPFISGNPSTALHEPNQLIISESYAKKYFGDENPMGKTLVIGSSGALNSEVAGVFRDFPKNSSIQFDIALPFSTFEKTWGPANLWQQMPSNYTFLRLHEQADRAALSAKLPGFAEKYVGEELPEWEAQYQLALQPLLDIHLYSDYGRERAQGDLKAMYLLALIALLVMAIAGINYVNYSTARFSKRAKEVGIRKVIGANRRSLVGHFLLETMVTVSVAAVGAILLTEMLLPLFNLAAGKEFLTADLRQPMWYALLFGLVLLVGLGAGIFPAFFLSGFRPVEALKGKFSKMSLSHFSRKGLVVVQFTSSVALLIATFLVGRQMDFVRDQIRPMGGEQVAVFQINSKLAEQFDALKRELLQTPAVRQVSGSSNVPSFYGDSWPLRRDLSSPEVQTENYVVENDFIPTMGYELLAGRSLDKSLASDREGAFVLNEKAMTALGFENPETALGEKIHWGSDEVKTGQVVGVVKDFHFQSFRDEVEPALLQFAPYEWMNTNFVTLRFQPEQVAELRRAVSQTVQKFDPAWHADLKFLDENFMAAHESDLRLGRIFMAFAGLAIFISCLGLLGLAAFAAEQRVKEIGIRKVLGATTVGIFRLLSKDFLSLVILSLVIASPLAYFLMEKWLANFAYRININWETFALAGGLAVAVAFFTVGFQSLKAALANPVESLRNE